MKHYFDSNQEELLLKFLAKQEVSLSDNQLEKLFDYVQLVIQGNEKVNLISRNDIPKFLSRHIADSLMPYIVLSKKNFLKPNMIWADMGAGGGCPGIGAVRESCALEESSDTIDRNRDCKSLSDVVAFVNVRQEF